MADAPEARWHGDNYQARFFWNNALNLLSPHSCVVEVTFEANGPKSFDDVVVKYDPAIARSGPERVSTDYHQIKWHTQSGGRFGYADLTDPGFIGAKTHSLLERLQNAQTSAPIGANFTFVTVYRIEDGDPLASLVSANDRSVLLDKLFDGTTDRSAMGKVRKLWRQHLQLTSDEQLRATLKGLRIIDGHLSLEELRAEISLKANVTGVFTESAAKSDFGLDELARQLKVRSLNAISKESLIDILTQEGMYADPKLDPGASDAIAIHTFIGAAADTSGAPQSRTLNLSAHFNQRYLSDSLTWQADIRPSVETHLRGLMAYMPTMTLHMNAHASVAFLAGSVLNVKAGTRVKLVQKGRTGTRVWFADDDMGGGGDLFKVRMLNEGSGTDLAVAIGVSQGVLAQTQQYIRKHLPNVGRIIAFELPSGAGQQNVSSGSHAARLADQMSREIRLAKGEQAEAVVHIFAACPNALLFYLGQQSQGIAPVILYEYDFDRQGNRSYQPSFVID